MNYCFLKHCYYVRSTNVISCCSFTKITYVLIANRSAEQYILGPQYALIGWCPSGCTVHEETPLGCCLSERYTVFYFEDGYLPILAAHERFACVRNMDAERSSIYRCHSHTGWDHSSMNQTRSLGQDNKDVCSENILHKLVYRSCKIWLTFCFYLVSLTFTGMCSPSKQILFISKFYFLSTSLSSITKFTSFQKNLFWRTTHSGKR